jgi:indoleamine 2,3-dioxygenase
MYSSTAPLAEHCVSETRGFLPPSDPLDRLSCEFEAWESAAHGLPKLLMSDHLRERLSALPQFPLRVLTDDRQLKRAMVVLSYLGHAYVWGGERPATQLPERIAVPRYEIATRLGRPPVLSYASYCLDNWYRFDIDREPELGNSGLIQNFLGGEDEEWFVLIHVDIELSAANAVAALTRTQEAALDGRVEDTIIVLTRIGDSIGSMVKTMRRMPEKCDPYMYYQRVRPFIHGWKNHPDLPEGLLYEGVSAYEGKPQTFRGETGAQSAIIPSLDAVLGVYHGLDDLKTYLMEMRQYMPPAHRAFLEFLESRSSVRDFVLKSGDSELRDKYDRCIQGVEGFRSIHLEFAAKYIFLQAQTDPKNPHQVGTGGTPFMSYLKKHRDETAAQRLG